MFLPVASNTIGDGAIVFVLFAVLLIVALGIGIIVLSLWLTSKINGSKGLVWGALLGVGVSHFWRILGLLLGSWDNASLLFGLVLRNAVEAAVLACVINLIIWKRRRESGISDENSDVSNDNSSPRYH